MTGPKKSKMCTVITLESSGLASSSYLAEGAVVEEEEGADESAQGAGGEAGAEPPQDAGQLRRRVAAGHQEDRVPSCQPEILHGRQWPSSKDSTIITAGQTPRLCVASSLILPVKSDHRYLRPPDLSVSSNTTVSTGSIGCYPTLLLLRLSQCAESSLMSSDPSLSCTDEPLYLNLPALKPPSLLSTHSPSYHSVCLSSA